MEQFLTQKEYMLSAKRALSKYVHNNNPSDDEIGFVAEYMMRADNKYKSDIGNREGFRMSYARFGCLTIAKKKQRYKVKSLQSLDYEFKSESGNQSMLDEIPSKIKEPHFYSIYNETLSFIKTTDTISDRNRSIFLDYYLNKMTLEKLSNKYDVCISGIKYIIESTAKKIKKEMNYTDE